MSFNLNDAESGSDLIPDGTVARAILTIRPGGAGDGGWLKTSSTGGLMLDTEWVIVEGKFAKRKVWRYMSLSEKAMPITLRQLRAAVEGHFGILPTDMSAEAMAKRDIKDIGTLNGIEACIMVGVEKSEGYADKNTIKAVLAPGEKSFLTRGQAAQGAGTVAAGAAGVGFAGGGYSAPPAAQPQANKPAWA